MRDWTERHFRELIDAVLKERGLTSAPTFDPTKMTVQNYRDALLNKLRVTPPVLSTGTVAVNYKLTGFRQFGQNTTSIYTMTLNMQSYTVLKDGMALCITEESNSFIDASDGTFTVGPAVFNVVPGSGQLTVGSKTTPIDISSNSPRDGYMSFRDNGSTVYPSNTGGMRVAWIAPTGFTAAAGGSGPFNYTCQVT